MGKQLNSEKLSGNRLLLKYMLTKNLKIAYFADGAIINPSYYPLSAVETQGAVLFADLPSFSNFAKDSDPIECSCYINHFFAWIQGETNNYYGGIIDKFIGDEIMIVFIKSLCSIDPIKAAMMTAKKILDYDMFSFSPKIGIAAGEFVISLVGSTEFATVSAIGNTVNLAARCVGQLEAKTIRIATKDDIMVKEIFNGHEWNISTVNNFEPKNMDKTKVIDVQRITKWILNTDYKEIIAKNVKYARNNGAIGKD